MQSSLSLTQGAACATQSPKIRGALELGEEERVGCEQAAEAGQGEEIHV